MPVDTREPETQTKGQRGRDNAGKETAAATARLHTPGKRRIRRIYIMTDLEGVAGVLDHDNWCRPGSLYNDLAKSFLTEEVNAAADGFLRGGATEILVADGHGSGGINPAQLDPRVELLRGWGSGYPLGLEEGWDALAYVGQHAKSRTECAHLAHTQAFSYLDLSLNGRSIGEFGQLVYCASELGIPTIFGSGDLAFTQEAAALVPGIETVAIKRGTRPGRGDELAAAAYGKKNLGAVHKQPRKVRDMIQAGATRALDRAEAKDFGLVPVQGPLRSVTILRQTEDTPRRCCVREHRGTVAELMNMPAEYQPIESDDQLAKLLGE